MTADPGFVEKIHPHDPQNQTGVILQGHLHFHHRGGGLHGRMGLNGREKRFIQTAAFLNNLPLGLAGNGLSGAFKGG